MKISQLFQANQTSSTKIGISKSSRIPNLSKMLFKKFGRMSHLFSFLLTKSLPKPISNMFAIRSRNTLSRGSFALLALASLFFLSACACAGAGGVGGSDDLPSLTLEIDGTKYDVNFNGELSTKISASLSKSATPEAAVISNLKLEEGSTAKDTSDNLITDGSSIPMQISGDNRRVEFNVTDEVGFTRTYTVNITIINTDANIYDLILTIAGSDHSISFDADGNDSINITTSLDKPPLDAIVKSFSFSDSATVSDKDGNAIDNGSTVAITNDDNNRSISLFVTAEDGSNRTYIVNITFTNTDANISALNLSLNGIDHSVTFDNNRATVNGLFRIGTNETNVTINTLTVSPGATVTDSAGNSIVDGRSAPINTGGVNPTVTLTVTAEDRSTSEHTITLDNIPPVNLGSINNSIYSVAFQPPNGLRLASGHADNSVKIWDATAMADTSTPIATLSGHTGLVRSVVFNPAGTKLVSGSDDDTIMIWDATVTADTSTPIITLGNQNNVANNDDDDVYAVAYSFDDSKIASGGSDNDIKIWDATQLGAATPTAPLIITLSGHSTNVNSVVFNPANTRLVSGSADDTIRIWDISQLDGSATQTAPLLATLSSHSDDVMSVSYSPDGSKFASASIDNTIKLWGAAAGNNANPIATLTVLDSSGIGKDVFSVAFSADSSKLASGIAFNDNTVKIWDADATTTANTSTPLTTLTGHVHTIRSVAYSGDGTRLASGSYAGIIKIWR